MIFNARPAQLALILALVGSTTPVPAQRLNQPRQTDATAVQPDISNQLRSCHELIGKNITNPNGETIADLSDLILDRGSGRVEYAVIKAGSVLGIGGKRIAIPYGAFRPVLSKEPSFSLDATSEQLKQFPEFTPESWSSMMESKKAEKNSLFERLSETGPWVNDPYAGSLNASDASTIEGEVTKVDRVRTGDFGEQVVVTVKTRDGTSRRIALGPSWFVSGGVLAPMRGDRVTIDTIAVPRDPDQLVVGTRVVRGQEERRLRGADGAPAWTVKSVESQGKLYNTPYWRHVLVSNLRGMKVDCRGAECGTVHDVIVDVNSGEVIFLSIDPNQNFLGIADTKRLVPWSVATIALQGSVRLDASKEMILASPESPRSIAELNGTRVATAYKAYDVPAPRFESARHPMVPVVRDAWSKTGLVCSAIDRSTERSLSGKIVEVTHVNLEGDFPPAKAIRVDVAGQEQLVLLGPSWYLDNQRLDYGKGDSVTLETCRTSINGKPYWIAKSISNNGTKIMLIDQDTPVWDPR